MTSDKASRWVKLYLNYAVIAALCATYMALSVLDIIPTGKSLPEILSEGVLTFLLATSINTLFRNFGLRLGEAEEGVVTAVAAHEREAAICAPHIDRLSEWCLGETRRVLRLERIRILADESLNYERCFDADGQPIPYEPTYIKRRPFSRGWLYAIRYNRMETRRMEASIRAACLKITPLSAGALLSEGYRPGDPFHMGRSKREFKSRTTREGLISRILTTVIFSYYGVTLLAEFSPAMLAWRVIQVIIFVAFGVMQQATAMDYMTDEFRARMTTKAAYLIQFRTGAALPAVDEVPLPNTNEKEDMDHGDQNQIPDE